MPDVIAINKSLAKKIAGAVRLITRGRNELAKLNWKRSKLSNPDWIEGRAACAVGGEYKILGTGNEYFVGYRRPKRATEQFCEDWNGRKCARRYGAGAGG